MREKRTYSIMVWVVSAAVVAVLLTTVSDASTLKILHSFIDLKRGANPQSSLVADAAGALYGTTPSGGTWGYGTVFRLTRGSDGKWTQSVLHSFGTTADDGFEPEGGVAIDPAGNLYGTTLYGGGGAYPYGTIFKLSPTASGQWTESVIYRFTGLNGDGSFPSGWLIFDAAGNLYGTTTEGGSSQEGAGTVFELMPTSAGVWTDRILYSFTGQADGSEPSAGLIFDKQGNLYGTAPYGGDLNCNTENGTAFGCGTVFKLTHQANGSWTQTVLLTFTGGEYDWSGPVGGVISDSAGNLYGMNGRAGSESSVFELVLKRGGNFEEKTLHNFGQADAFPVGDLILDAAGNLYGVTATAVFRLTPRSVGYWRETLLHEFRVADNGDYPGAGLIADSAGNLYGTTAYGGGARNLGVVFELTPSPKGFWKETVLYRFPSTDGSNPYGALIADSEGNFYGTTNDGGINECYNGGCGMVFKLSHSADGKWLRTALYEFKGGTDGYNPVGTLLFDHTGNLYGTTVEGGSGGYGTVFELTPLEGGAWKEKVLYSFQGGSDGAFPESGLIFDGSGNLYGTTTEGGVCTFPGCGVVFKLSPRADGRWVESVIYAFQGSDGGAPYAGLIFDSADNLYGTAEFGGPNNKGVVFQLSPHSGGWQETVLYVFSGPDGAGPQAGVIFDAQGNLYGTTGGGGTGYNASGTVFRLTKTGQQWTETVLHTFTVNDGATPLAGLVIDEAGNLYGTTWEGGPNLSGNVFKLSPHSKGQWYETVLHNFIGPPDGSLPTAGLIFGQDGKLYGTTSRGGPGGYFYGGTVYSIEP